MEQIQFTKIDVSITLISSISLNNMNQITLQMLKQIINETIRNAINDQQKKSNFFELSESSKNDEQQKSFEFF